MKTLVVFFLTFLYALSIQAKPIELVMWHAMSGDLGDEVRLLANKFNDSQSQYVIKPVYKGNYIETLTSFAAAFRAHQPPAIVQVFEVGTAIMLSPEGVIKPVDIMMREQGMALPKADFIQSVLDYYSQDGQLMAMPFNLSTPVLYYNASILAKVGYSSANFPRTWAEMELLAAKIKQAGYDCTYTSAYPGWVLFESYLAIHGLSMLEAPQPHSGQQHQVTIQDPLIRPAGTFSPFLGRRENERDYLEDKPVRAVFALPELKHHLQRLKRWYDLHYFKYGGRIDDATALFSSEVCPLFSQSSGAYNSLASLVPFKLGVALMPLDTYASKVRHANVAGGAALWVVAGQSAEEYKGIAQFFVFVAQPEIQKHWHEHTGYLPLGLKGVYASIVNSSHHPVLRLARSDLEDNFSVKRTSKHFGPQNQLRAINEEVLEAMFAGLKSPEEALNEAVLRSNHILLRFARNTQRTLPPKE